MKKITALFALAIFALSVATAQARNNTPQTTVVGAAGGALVGQAIGRNTESALFGAAFGGVVGYLVGSEMDRDGHARQVSYARHAPSRTYVYATQPHRLVKIVVVPEHGYRNGPKQWRGNKRDYYKQRHHRKDYYRDHRHNNYAARGGDHYRVVNW